MDDFLNRAEVALYAFGFTGDNSIGEEGAHCRHACISGTWIAPLSSFWLIVFIHKTNKHKYKIQIQYKYKYKKKYKQKKIQTNKIQTKNSSPRSGH